MKRMWAVSHGEYSDYGVICLCETEAEAQRIAAVMNGPDSLRMSGYEHQVESFDVATPSDVIGYTTLILSCVIEAGTGNVYDERESMDYDWRYAVDPEPRAVEVDVTQDDRRYKPRWRMRDRSPGELANGVELRVRGADHERVRKAYSERRARLIAEAAGIA